MMVRRRASAGVRDLPENRRVTNNPAKTAAKARGSCVAGLLRKERRASAGVCDLPENRRVTINPAKTAGDRSQVSGVRCQVSGDHQPSIIHRFG